MRRFISDTPNTVVEKKMQNVYGCPKNTAVGWKISWLKIAVGRSFCEAGVSLLLILSSFQTVMALHPAKEEAILAWVCMSALYHLSRRFYHYNAFSVYIERNDVYCRWTACSWTNRCSESQTCRMEICCSNSSINCESWIMKGSAVFRVCINSGKCGVGRLRYVCTF